METEEPRAWGDNHDWVEYNCKAVGAGNMLLLRGQKIEIRWVFQSENYKETAAFDALFFRGLAYDREGNFYGVTQDNPTAVSDGEIIIVRKLIGKAALTWFAQHASWDAAFTRELIRAFDNPSFAFMPLVPVRVPDRRKRKKAKAAETFHEQLLMATALVECVRKLEDAPTVENLADACRSASKLHQAVHQPENFKLVSNG